MEVSCQTEPKGRIRKCIVTPLRIAKHSLESRIALVTLEIPIGIRANSTQLYHLETREGLRDNIVTVLFWRFGGLELAAFDSNCDGARSLGFGKSICEGFLLEKMYF